MMASNQPIKTTWKSRIIKLPLVSSRVGHGLIQHEGSLYMIGGGSEDGEVKEILELSLDLNLDTVTTKLLSVPNFPGLYEFSANKVGSILWIFGGSDQHTAKNDVYSFNLESHVYQLHEPSSANKSEIPPPRTQYGNKCLVNLEDGGLSLVVFGGGAQAENAVNDDQLYVFSLSSHDWKRVLTNGDTPNPRQGHVMASVGSKVYIHGGLTGATLFDDMHFIDLSETSPSWVELDNEVRPQARAAHNIAVILKDIYIYGGLSTDGSALADLWKFDTESCIWSQIHYIGPQSPRLDFGMCSYAQDNSTGLLLHGGVDPGGQFFQDFVLIMPSGEDSSLMS